MFGAMVGKLASSLYRVLPNLQKFSIKTEILNLSENINASLPPQTLEQIPYLILYGVAYAVSGYVIAYWIFRRKEL